MTDLKNEIIEKYDVRPSTAEGILNIINIVDEISKVEYRTGEGIGHYIGSKGLNIAEGPKAEQMFKNLGYSILTNDEYEIYYHNDKTGEGVKFLYEDLKFYVLGFYSEELNTFSIDMPLLKAINQQCKELEWID